MKTKFLIGEQGKKMCLQFLRVVDFKKRGTGSLFNKPEFIVSSIGKPDLIFPESGDEFTIIYLPGNSLCADLDLIVRDIDFNYPPIPAKEIKNEIVKVMI